MRMKNSLIKCAAMAAVAALGYGCASTTTSGPSALELREAAAEYSWPDPTRFEEAIAAFEAEEQPPRGAIVGIGSSSMRGWRNAINDDLAPLTIIPRGFGGSGMFDALHYVDRIVTPYEPRAVILYEGDNDVIWNIPPEGILTTFRAFAAAIHEELPETRIYILSVKPSPARWGHWPAMQETNELLRLESETDDRLFFIDVSTPMLDESGQPIDDLYIGDRLHMTRQGYEVWRDAVRPVIIPIESRFE